MRKAGPAGTLLALAALPLLGGCADTISPVLGGLKIGMRGGSFHMPALLNEELPFEYPRSAWREGVGGETTLRIHISRQGSVDSAYVLKTSGNVALDSAALDGVRRLRYRPARQGESPVAVWAVLPVRYPMPEKIEEPERR